MKSNCQNSANDTLMANYVPIGKFLDNFTESQIETVTFCSFAPAGPICMYYKYHTS